jgi:tRNA(fMet)-specific endonuclease VapC
VVACELRFGALRKGSAVLTLERAGTPIGSNDRFIAARTRSHGLTLVTHNVREFERVPGQKVEDWLAASG